MTISLITEGLIGGGGGDASPPVLAAVSPTPNTAPGAPGGFSDDFAIATTTPVVIDLTDTDGVTDIVYSSAFALFLDGTVEAVMSGGTYLGKYVSGSSETGITNGVRLSMKRDGGWPGAGLLSNLSVGILLVGVDKGGNVVSATYYYEMPSGGVNPLPPPVVAPSSIIGTIDHLTAAINRLPEQFKAKAT